jgi:hypothetical protein
VGETDSFAHLLGETSPGSVYRILPMARDCLLQVAGGSPRAGPELQAVGPGASNPESISLPPLSRALPLLALTKALATVLGYRLLATALAWRDSSAIDPRGLRGGADRDPDADLGGARAATVALDPIRTSWSFVITDGTTSWPPGLSDQDRPNEAEEQLRVWPLTAIENLDVAHRCKASSDVHRHRLRGLCDRWRVLGAGHGAGEGCLRGFNLTTTPWVEGPELSPTATQYVAEGQAAPERTDGSRCSVPARSAAMCPPTTG